MRSFLPAFFGALLLTCVSASHHPTAAQTENPENQLFNSSGEGSSAAPLFLSRPGASGNALAIRPYNLNTNNRTAAAAPTGNEFLDGINTAKRINAERAAAYGQQSAMAAENRALAISARLIFPLIYIVFV